MNRNIIALAGLFIYFHAFSQTENEEWFPSLKDWKSDMSKGFCAYVNGEKTIEGNHFYSPAFIHLADISGAVQPPGDGKSYNMDLVDKNVIRKYLEFNFTHLQCGDRNFLANAFEANNRDLLDDLLEISIIFFDGSQYAYWNYNITKVKTTYGNGVEESFISYLVNSEDHERALEWLDLIDRRVVRSMKYIYQTNSKQIIVYLLKNDPEMIHRTMQYGPGGKLTFLGFVESQPDSERKTEWLALLKSGPDQLNSGETKE